MTIGNGRFLRALDSELDGVENLASALMQFTSRVTSALEEIVDLLTPPELPPALDSDSQPEALIQRVRVNTAGTVVQGPDVAIPQGVASVIRQRRHTTSPNGRIALNEHDVSSTGTRIETVNGDTIILTISNWNKLWFDSDTNETDFELIAEQ